MTYIAQFLTNKGKHTVLYKINKNVHIKPQLYQILFIILHEHLFLR